MTSARPGSPSGDAPRADSRTDELDARIKRAAWVLGSLALVFYVGYIAYYFWRSAAGA